MLSLKQLCLATVLLFSAAVTMVYASVSRISINADLYVRRLQDGVLVITHSFPWAANSLVVEMENSDLVKVTKDLLTWIALQYGNREISAINTGFHCDNLGGDGYWPQSLSGSTRCMIIGWNGVGNTSDANLDAWPESLRNLLRFDVDVVVPGHGERLDVGLFRHTMELLELHRK